MEITLHFSPETIRITPRSISRGDGYLVLDFEREMTFPGEVVRRESSDPGEEWPQFVRTERIAADAGKRAASRVGAVLKAVAAYVASSETDDSITFHASHALAVLDMELAGVGGPRGLGGDATRRMTWTTSLGKGRKQASDGGAWTSAIEQARGLLRHMSSAEVTPEDATLTVAGFLIAVDCEWAVAWAARKALAASTPEQARAWLAVAEMAVLEGSPTVKERWALRIGTGHNAADTAHAVRPPAADFE